MDNQKVFSISKVVRWGLEICLNENVYDPSDDTYMLLEYMDENSRKIEDAAILDIGCGTGILSLYALFLGAKYTICIDINPFSSMTSLCTLESGEKKYGFKGLYDIIRGDITTSIRTNRLFDLVLFNPPYLPIECDDDWLSVSWCGGKGGISLVLRTLRDAKYLVNRDGEILFIVSSKGDLKSLFDASSELGLVFDVVKEKSFFFEKIFLVRGVVV